MLLNTTGFPTPVIGRFRALLVALAVVALMGTTAGVLAQVVAARRLPGVPAASVPVRPPAATPRGVAHSSASSAISSLSILPPAVPANGMGRAVQAVSTELAPSATPGSPRPPRHTRVRSRSVPGGDRAPAGSVPDVDLHDSEHVELKTVTGVIDDRDEIGTPAGEAVAGPRGTTDAGFVPADPPEGETSRAVTAELSTPDAYHALPSDVGQGRWIDVDLTRQMVTAYEGTAPVRAVAVSTGLPGTPTPQGQFRIWIKLRYDDMEGPGYYLRDVPYTMYFHRGYGLHGTYWHSNFGHPMSHGCVNLPTPEAEWLFDWAEVGTLVNVHS